MTTTSVPEYIPEFEKWLVSQLSPESQQVLLRHYQSIKEVMNDQKTWTNQVPESTGETPKFWLTIEEKQSIENDINAGKPIMATPAYTKFLSVLLPNGLKVEDEKWLLKFSRDIPEYEIYNGAIRANYAGAMAIISEWLSELFGRSVLLPTSNEVQDRVAEYNHYAGFRFSGGESLFVGALGQGWIFGHAISVGAQYAWRNRSSYAGVNWDVRHTGLSLFPRFE